MLSIPADEPRPAGQKTCEIEQAIRNSPPEPGARLTGWVFVAEWVDTDGLRMIAAQTDLPPWTSSGLIRWAADNEIAYGGDDDDVL